MDMIGNASRANRGSPGDAHYVYTLSAYTLDIRSIFGSNCTRSDCLRLLLRWDQGFPNVPPGFRKLS